MYGLFKVGDLVRRLDPAENDIEYRMFAGNVYRVVLFRSSSAMQVETSGGVMVRGFWDPDLFELVEAAHIPAPVQSKEDKAPVSLPQWKVSAMMNRLPGHCACDILIEMCNLHR